MTLPDAVLAMIRGAVPDVDVFDGEVPETPPARYAVVYIDVGTRRALAACGRSDSATLRWQVTAVAADREMAAWLATKILDETLDRSPSADGWVCGQIKHVFSERPGRDETVQAVPVVYKPDLYDLLATRA